jgi:hypothetical protein
MKMKTYLIAAACLAGVIERECVSRVCDAPAQSRQQKAVGGYLPYQRGTTIASRANFPSCFNSSTLAVRFGSVFEMWTE